MKKISILSVILTVLPLAGCIYSSSQRRIPLGEYLRAAHQNTASAIFFTNETDHSYSDYDYVVLDALLDNCPLNEKPVNTKFEYTNYLLYQATFFAGPADSFSWFSIYIYDSGFIKAESGNDNKKFDKGQGYTYKFDKESALYLIQLGKDRYNEINETINEERLKAEEEAKIENFFSNIKDSKTKRIAYYDSVNHCQYNIEDDEIFELIEDLDYERIDEQELSKVEYIDTLIEYSCSNDWSLKIQRDCISAIVHYKYEGTFGSYRASIYYFIDYDKTVELESKIKSLVNV